MFEDFFSVRQSVFCVRSHVLWKMKTITTDPLDLQVHHPESTKHRLNIFGEKNARKFYKAQNLNLLCAGNYWHSTDTVLGTISSLEIT